MKFAKLSTPSGLTNIALPCTLQDIRQVYGVDVILFDKKNLSHTFFSNSYELNDDIEYVLARGPGNFGNSRNNPSNLITLEQLAVHLQALNSKYPTQELQNKLSEALKYMALLPAKVTTSSLDRSIVELKGMRLEAEDAAQVGKIDAALFPLQTLQQGLLDPVLTWLLDNYQNQK